MNSHLGWLLVLALGGCQRATLEGTVVDPTGAPIPGARVAVVGQLCNGTADAAGRFVLPCGPGDHELAVMQQGYVSESRTIAAPDERPYPLGAITLLPIPEGRGLFVLHGATWGALTPIGLERRVTPDRTRHSTCLLDPAAAGTPVPVEATLYAKDGADIEVFRVDADGCARHVERTGAGWSAVDTARPPRTERAVTREDRVIHLTLTPGRYVVAPWHAGDFTEDLAAAREAGGKRYRAWLLEAAAP